LLGGKKVEKYSMRGRRSPRGGDKGRIHKAEGTKIMIGKWRRRRIPRLKREKKKNKRSD